MRDPSKDRFDAEGHAGPFALAHTEPLFEVLKAFPHLGGRRNQHVVSREIRALLADRELVKTVTALCGEDLLVWRTAFFTKAEGAGEIGWHHDKHFQSADDEISFAEMDKHFSLFIGVTDVDLATGRIEVIPGSHRSQPSYPRDRRPFHRRPFEDHFRQDIPPDLVATRRGIDVPQGSFLIFHSALLHRSLSHQGGPQRLGLAVRLMRKGIEAPPELAAPGDILP